LSAIQEIQQAYDVPVLSIIQMSHIIDYLGQHAADDTLTRARADMQVYRDRYGV
jgi:orotate phosphoribosyltransferase